MSDSHEAPGLGLTEADAQKVDQVASDLGLDVPTILVDALTGIKNESGVFGTYSSDGTFHPFLPSVGPGKLLISGDEELGI